MRKKLIDSLIITAMTAALFLTGLVPHCVAESVYAAGEPETTMGYGGETELSPAVVLKKGSGEVPELNATSAILIDAGSGAILYEKDAYDKRDPASITKILNAMVVLDNLKLSDTYVIPDGLETVGHIVNLKAGEELTIEQLLYAMLIYSGNDAAEALAYAAGGDIKTFCSMMNERARACGAESTNFTNANGLNNYGQENHRTTAYDLALISREAMKNKTFRKIVSAKRYTIPATNKSKERKLRNTNALLYEKPFKMDGKKFDCYYEGTTGIKTGMTSVAGECFAGSAKRGKTELIAVVLNAATAQDKFDDAIELFDYGFTYYRTYTAAKSSEVIYELKVKNGSLAQVDLGIAEDMDITVNRGYEAAENITTEIVFARTYADDENAKTNEERIKWVKAPVKKGTVFGHLVAYNEKGEAVAIQELIALEEVQKGGILSNIGIADEELPLFFLILSMVIILILILRITRNLRRAKRRRRRRTKRQRAISRREAQKQRSDMTYRRDKGNVRHRR